MEMVDAENPKKPVFDQKITDELNKQGIRYFKKNRCKIQGGNGNLFISEKKTILKSLLSCDSSFLLHTQGTKCLFQRLNSLYSKILPCRLYVRWGVHFSRN